MTPRQRLDQWLCGNTLNLQSNCNSKYRELQRAKDRNDKDSVSYWTKRIEQIKEVQDILFIVFYSREDTIKDDDSFKNFIKLFERFTQIKTKNTINNIYTGAL